VVDVGGGLGCGTGVRGTGGLGAGGDGDGVDGDADDEDVACEMGLTVDLSDPRVTATRRRTTASSFRRAVPVRVDGMTTMRGAAGSATAWGREATFESTGELDSKAARQRYPEVTPAATSRQSRSASNEIRTPISIALLPDSIGAEFGLRQAPPLRRRNHRGDGINADHKPS
jgi:hypothetical protein